MIVAFVHVDMYGRWIILAIKIMNDKSNSIFAFSEINTDSFRETMAEITKGMGHLDAFTEDLEKKVDDMLKAQQSQFVHSYKQHMWKIKEQFKKLEDEIKRKESQIAEYENSGKMSNLIKRVSFLQEQEKKHLKQLDKKQQEIRELVLEKSISLAENKRLQQKIKELIRQKSRAEDKLQQSARNMTTDRIPTFATEISPSKSRDQLTLTKMMTQQRSIDRSLARHSQRTELSLNPELTPEYHRLQKQIKLLKKQNRQLMAFNTRFMDGSSTMENFFIETVAEIKKNINSRKQTKECSLQDFRKEDKLELLIKVLSNDDILVHLHEKLFAPSNKKQMSIDQSIINDGTRDKIRQLRSARNRFPSINSTRLQ